jgi:RNA polymerase sigma-70 factor (ECF subfamily)
MEPAACDFDAVYRSLSPAVLGYLRSQGCADPEATCSEVFLRVFRAIDTFAGSPDKLRSWVFTVAHNIVVDERRFASRRPVSAGVTAAELPGLAGGDSEVDALTRLLHADLMRVLGALAPAQRDVLLLRFVADLSLEDVATATGRSVGAIKALQHRALDALRKVLGVGSREAVSP